MKKVLFIINPTAGKERMKRHLMSVLDLFTKADWDVTVHITQAALDATNVAQKQGADFDMIVCSGGDGTLSETISGMTRLYTAAGPGLYSSRDHQRFCFQSSDFFQHHESSSDRDRRTSAAGGYRFFL